MTIKAPGFRVFELHSNICRYLQKKYDWIAHVLNLQAHLKHNWVDQLAHLVQAELIHRDEKRFDFIDYLIALTFWIILAVKSLFAS